MLNDLESRMAELVTEKLTGGREVIHAQDVREVLEVMGAPADMGDQGSSSSDSDYRYERRYKRMYRDPDDKPIGGVCSGLAYYFNTDPLLIRILFVIGFFVGFGFILYLVLWIALPMAETPAEIEEMRAGSNIL